MTELPSTDAPVKPPLGVGQVIMITLNGLLVIVAISVQLLWVPQFPPLFEEQGAALPKLTEIVIRLSQGWSLPMVAAFWLAAFGLVTLARFRLKNVMVCAWLGLAFMVAIIAYGVLIVAAMYMPMIGMLQDMQDQAAGHH